MTETEINLERELDKKLTLTGFATKLVNFSKALKPYLPTDDLQTKVPSAFLDLTFIPGVKIEKGFMDVSSFINLIQFYEHAYPQKNTGEYIYGMILQARKDGGTQVHAARKMFSSIVNGFRSYPPSPLQNDGVTIRFTETFGNLNFFDLYRVDVTHTLGILASCLDDKLCLSKEVHKRALQIFKEITLGAGAWSYDWMDFMSGAREPLTKEGYISFLQKTVSGFHLNDDLIGDAWAMSLSYTAPSYNKLSDLFADFFEQKLKQEKSIYETTSKRDTIIEKNINDGLKEMDKIKRGVKEPTATGKDLLAAQVNILISTLLYYKKPNKEDVMGEDIKRILIDCCSNELKQSMKQKLDSLLKAEGVHPTSRSEQKDKYTKDITELIAKSITQKQQSKVLALR